MSLAWMAQRLRIGAWSNVSNLLRTAKSAKSEDTCTLNAPELSMTAIFPVALFLLYTAS
jgi:hypothetical protein